AEALTIATPADTKDFEPMKALFASLPAAKSMGDLAKGGGGGGGSGGGEAPASVGTPGQPVPRPSAQYRDIKGGKVFQAAVPDNWTSLPSKSAIKVVPQNGYGQLNGQTMFTHGVEFGISKAGSRDLQEATKAWLQAVAQNNPQLKLAGGQQALR